MSPTTFEDDLAEIKDAAPKFFIFGGLQILIGLIALSYAVFITEVSVILLGWLLLIGGFIEVFHSVAHRRWRGFFIDLLSGLLSLVVGLLVVAHPEIMAKTLTAVIALFLLFGGLFRIAVALAIQAPHWGYLLLNGIVTFGLGLAILKKWPADDWVIGLFIGINIIMNGVVTVMLAISLREPPPPKAVMSP
jgi:uncharacterized membrane protein HdeD (DUF308 family)